MQLTSEAENYDLISKTWQESENEGDEPATIKYISEIHVVMKMIVTYCETKDM
jgi:hypothetical protein